jgi:hypothetical protein
MAKWEDELDAILRALGVTWEDSFGIEPTGVGSAAGASSGGARMDLDMVRHEIEATVAQVAQLVQAGRLDAALKDDVMVVLRSLTRPPVPAPGESEKEAQLAAAATILHFCRIVLRLANVASLMRSQQR